MTQNQANNNQANNNHYCPQDGNQMFRTSDFEQEKLLALASYFSLFIGIPLFIIPLAMRGNDFAKYHAKHAAVAFCLQFILAFAMVFFSMVTLGLGFFAFPIVFLPWIPTVHGIILAINGEWREPVMLFGITDRIFGTFQTQNS